MQTAPADPDTNDASSSRREEESLRTLIEHCAHYLPCQGPIEVFVHHNTLHAFEEQSFHEAVQSGFARYHAEPYLSEREYRKLYAEGRITDEDLQTVVASSTNAASSDPTAGPGTRSQLRLAMLRHPMHVGPDAEMRWIIAEADALNCFREEVSHAHRYRIIEASRKWLYEAETTKSVASDGWEELFTTVGRNSSTWSDRDWESFSLHLLWRVCQEGTRTQPTEIQTEKLIRPRDQLLQATDQDTDRNVHEMLIRFCAAFVDQGYSDWALPNRDQGFFESFVALYAGHSGGLPRWLRDLPHDLSMVVKHGLSAEQSIALSLDELKVAEDDREEFLVQSLLALGGWAGMIWQLESGVDWVVHSIPDGSLVGMLAVQLILEKHSIRDIGEEIYGESESIARILQLASERHRGPEVFRGERMAFVLFQVAQLVGWTPQQLANLSVEEWHHLAAEVGQFPDIERRRCFHEAY
jgi:hypothetical protein